MIDYALRLSILTDDYWLFLNSLGPRLFMYSKKDGGRLIGKSTL